MRKTYNELDLRVQDRTAELTQTNEALRKEILNRKLAEEALGKARDDLEHKVQERTAELRKSHDDFEVGTIVLG